MYIKQLKLGVCLSVSSVLLTACASVPGNTRADFILAGDTKKLVIMSAMLKAPRDCKTYKIINTETSESKNLSFTGVWKEIWTVNACGTKIAVPVMFVPDGVGGTYMNVDGKNIKIIQ